MKKKQLTIFISHVSKHTNHHNIGGPDVLTPNTLPNFIITTTCAHDKWVNARRKDGDKKYIYVFDNFRERSCVDRDKEKKCCSESQVASKYSLLRNRVNEISLYCFQLPRTQVSRYNCVGNEKRNKK